MLLLRTLLSRILSFGVLIIFAAAPMITHAQVMSGGAYQIQRDSINPGGGRSAGGSYVIEDTLGQTASGDVSGATYRLGTSGYQQTTSTTVTTVTPTPTGSSSTGRRNKCELMTNDTTINEGQSTLLTYEFNRTNGDFRLEPFGVVGNKGTLAISPVQTTTYQGYFNNKLLCQITVVVDQSQSVIEAVNQSMVVNENEKVIELSFSRAGASSGAVSASIATFSASALESNDFFRTIQTLTWNPDDTSVQTIRIPIIDDTQIESLEDFLVQIVNVSNNAVIGNRQTIVSIIDDDVPITQPALVARPLTAVDTEKTTITIVPQVLNNGDGYLALEDISVALNNRTALYGVPIDVGLADTIQLTTEPIEGYSISLLGDAGCPVVLGQAVATQVGQEIVCQIIFDDIELTTNQTISFVQQDYIVNESERQVMVDIMRQNTGDISKAVSITVVATSGSAKEKRDFDSIQQKVTWQAYEYGSKGITVSIIDDLQTEKTESFLLQITGSTSVVDYTVDTANITITDDDTCDGFTCNPLAIAGVVLLLLGGGRSLGVLGAGLFGGSTALANLRLLPKRIIQFFVTPPNNYKYWGTVLDADGSPLDPATIELYDAEGNFLERTTTRRDGTFRFKVDTTRPGYKIKAHKKGYIFPADRVSWSLPPEIPNNLNFGELFTVPDDPFDFIDLPFKPVSPQVVSKKIHFFSRARGLIATFLDVAMLFGFAYWVYQSIIAPGLLSYVALTVYIVFTTMWIIGIHASQRGVLKFKDSPSKSALAMIAFVSKSTGRIIRVHITNKKGEFVPSLTPAQQNADIRIYTRDAMGAYQKAAEVITKGKLPKRLKARLTFK